ncbi:LLM class F420-dependent oxidoreductase [Williamsia serinedens]|nr:LLM class F420-dependent oxidoreductase [Williamsia serinedens]
MDLGLHYHDFLSFPPERIGTTIAATARAAEDVGFTLFTVADHMFQMEMIGRAEDPFLESYTTLGFLAGQTKSITLAALVTAVTYRHPGVLVKAMTTLDVLAEGRTILGLGAAWYQREHDALGIPFPPAAIRLERLEETLRICRQMWSDDHDGPFEGKHFRLAETICQPQPLRPPPILIGGSGERRLLRIVAQYADIWNTTDGLSRLPGKVEVLRRHCASVDRDFSQIRLTASTFVDPFSNVDVFLRLVDSYAELGFTLLTVGPLPGRTDPVGFVERFGEDILPRISD